MNYLMKPVEVPCGETAAYWKGTTLAIDLSTGKGVVGLSGYFTVEMLLAQNGGELGHVDCTIQDVRQLTNYEAFFIEALTMLVSDQGGVFYGGVPELCEVPEYGRSLIKPTTVESGVLAECWRCRKLKADLRKGTVTLDMVGWVDSAAFCSGKDPASGHSRRWRAVLPLSEFGSYQDLYAEIVYALATDPECLIYAAELRATE